MSTHDVCVPLSIGIFFFSMRCASLITIMFILIINLWGCSNSESFKNAILEMDFG